MAEFVYALCAGTSILCVIMLFRGYLASRTQLLFWACLCFAGLAVNNLLLFVDLIILPDVRSVDLAPRRRRGRHECAAVRPNLGVEIRHEIISFRSAYYGDRSRCPIFRSVLAYKR